MKKVMFGVMMLGTAAFLLTGCGQEKKVAQEYLDAQMSGDRVTLKRLTKSDDRLNKAVITDVTKDGNEAIISFKIEAADGSVKKGTENMRLVVFKDKTSGDYLIDEERSSEETMKAQSKEK